MVALKISHLVSEHATEPDGSHHKAQHSKSRLSDSDLFFVSVLRPESVEAFHRVPSLDLLGLIHACCLWLTASGTMTFAAIIMLCHITLCWWHAAFCLFPLKVWRLVLLGTTSQHNWEEPERRTTRLPLSTHIQVSKKALFMTVNRNLYWIQAHVDYQYWWFYSWITYFIRLL